MNFFLTRHISVFFGCDIASWIPFIFHSSIFSGGFITTGMSFFLTCQFFTSLCCSSVSLSVLLNIYKLIKSPTAVVVVVSVQRDDLEMGMKWSEREKSQKPSVYSIKSTWKGSDLLFMEFLFLRFHYFTSKKIS